MAVAVTLPGAPTEGLEEIALLGSLFPYQCQAGAGHYTTNRERGRSYWGVERRELSQGACAQTLPPLPRCWRRSGASSGGLPDNWRQKCSGRVLMCTGVLQYRAWGSVIVLMCSRSSAVHCLGLCHCVQSPPRHHAPRCSCRLGSLGSRDWAGVQSSVNPSTATGPGQPQGQPVLI